MSRRIELELVTGAAVAEKAPKAGLYQLMETSGLQFEIINNQPDDRYNGHSTFQWLHATARALNPRDRYLVQIDLKGEGGVLELELQGTMRGEIRRHVTLARSLLELRGQSRTRTHELVVDLLDFPELEPEQLATKGLHVQWILRWRPDSETARLEGTTRITSLTDS